MNPVGTEEESESLDESILIALYEFSKYQSDERVKVKKNYRKSSSNVIKASFDTWTPRRKISNLWLQILGFEYWEHTFSKALFGCFG